jgi:hypothetical protein
MPKQRQGNVRDDASAARTPAPRQWQWQRSQGNVREDASAAMATMPKRRQGNFRNDASAITATRASNVISVAMATMPKRRWQRRQPDDYNDASATTATMAMAPGQHPRWQRNACIIISGMLAMTPAATLPRKAILHDGFATMGNFAEDSSFAEEGNFTAEGNVAEGWWLRQAK